MNLLSQKNQKNSEIISALWVGSEHCFKDFSDKFSETKEKNESILSPKSKTIDFNTLKVMAEDGDAEAQYRLGKMYETGSQVEENFILALEWYQRAASQNHLESQFSLQGIPVLKTYKTPQKKG